MSFSFFFFFFFKVFSFFFFRKKNIVSKKKRINFTRLKDEKNNDALLMDLCFDQDRDLGFIATNLLTIVTVRTFNYCIR